jgi:hypothetical protein
MPQDLSSIEELKVIAEETYIYAYPLVIMDITRRIFSNTSEATNTGAPSNTFLHRSTFPDDQFTDVVRPNVDTLYSLVWFDVTTQALLIDVPDSGGRYYLLPFLDLWSDVFAVPGSRTTGTGPQRFVITGPGWTGAIPTGATEIKSPTGFGWLIGRTQTNGVSDFPNVLEFQAKLTTTVLDADGNASPPPAGTVDPNLDQTPPVEQIAAMSAADFFTMFANLMMANPPHQNDYSMVFRMSRLGIVPGQRFDYAAASPEQKAAIDTAPKAAQSRIIAALKSIGTQANHWNIISPPVGTYGTAYFQRTLIAFAGLGANEVNDALYPTAFTDDDGQPYDSAQRYVWHANADEVPPVNAFWSLTMYNDRQFLARNPLNRFAIGDRDPLVYGSDGSLDIYIQRDSPGTDKEANWLPAPASGGFTMNLRLYWPRSEALSGEWVPPPVKRVE